MTATNTPWPDDKIAAMKGHIAAKMTKFQTAQAMGVSVNSIAGKAHKLGLVFTPVAEWTAEEITALRKHVADGLSAKQTGEAMGKTRNSCLTKASRLGLSFGKGNGVAPVREPPAKKPPAPRPVATASAINPHLKTSHCGTVVSLTGAHEGSRPAILAHISHGACRWPLTGEGADLLMCGAPAERKADGAPRSYCETHHRAASTPAYKTPNQAMRGLRRYTG